MNPSDSDTTTTPTQSTPKENTIMQTLAELGGIFFILVIIGFFLWSIWSIIDLQIQSRIREHNYEENAHGTMLRLHNGDKNAHYEAIKKHNEAGHAHWEQIHKEVKEHNDYPFAHQILHDPSRHRAVETTVDGNAAENATEVAEPVEAK
jgi:hypothetical protein